MAGAILNLESTKYALRLDNFEGPLDLLVFLIDKNKMNIYDIKISDITDQYIEYLKEQEKLNLEIASEFLVMASTLILIKSRGLLPKEVDDEAELTEEELLQRIIEYKRYKEISKLFRTNLEEGAGRIYKFQEKIELPKQVLEQKFTIDDIVTRYRDLVERNENKKNENAKNIDKIAIHETYSVSDKVKEIFKELIKRPKFVFNKLFSLKEKPKAEVVTAFSGVLELSRRNRIIANQDTLFGDIVISKATKGELKEEELKQDGLI